LHGGEATEGAIDDSIRHAITKMARFHFAAAEPYARRIVQMGEDPDRVFVVGALAADNISRVQLSDRETLSQSVGLKLGEPLFVVTYHPTTAQAEGDGKAIAALTGALEGVLADHPDATVIVTGTNADAGHAAIRAALDEFAARHPGRVICVQSLGREPYVSAVALADAVVGNSSSGIIEAPLLGTPTVNIGTREKGRLRAPSVIDVAPNEKSIADAIRRALGDDMRAIAARRQSPYAIGQPAAEIANILAAVKLGQTAKPFHDMTFGEAEVSP
jgi:UDP-hydrolysing UDP-N-acetyl-D-glucosamine 2-epimerase